MEITNEIKAKVFGQYLSYFADQPTRFAFLKIIENLLNGVGVKYRIELKPLSTISDEDFIEASKLLPYDFKTDKGFDVFRGEAPFRIYRGKGSTVASNIVYANTTGTKIFKIFVDDAKIMLDDRIAPPCYTNHTLIIYQFLQSKGYDLPNYHLGGKTLEESGLAYYEDRGCSSCKYYSNTCARYIMNPNLDRQECGKPETGYPHWEPKNNTYENKN